MRLSILLISTLFIGISSFAQNIGVGTNTPHSSAKLEVFSSNSGFLPPRMTLDQRNAILNPAAGLIVWCTNCNTTGGLYVFDGTEWKPLGYSVVGNSLPIAPSNLQANANSIQVLLSWTDNSTNETGFVIERKTGNGTFASIGTSGANFTAFTDSAISPNSVYVYRIFSINGAGPSLGYSNELTVSIGNTPQIRTLPVSSITFNSAISGGNIIYDGGNPILKKGIVWGTTPNPSINLVSKTEVTTPGSSFSGSLFALTQNTTYYVRAYVVTGVGIGYGEDIVFTTTNSGGPVTPGPSFTDIDNNTYNTIVHCSQVWPNQNLKVSRYRNGDPIPQITAANQSYLANRGAWCWYNFDSVNYSSYGKLYNWHAITDPRGLLPDGWHIPSKAEMDSFSNCFGGDSLAGGKLKLTGTYEDGTGKWFSPNTGATNSSGFNGAGSGYNIGGFNTNGDTASFSSAFQLINRYGLYWSSTEYDSINASGRYLFSNNNYFIPIIFPKTAFLSIRPVSNNGRTTSLPVVSTRSSSNILYNTATCSGQVSDTGNCPLLARGIIYGTDPVPDFNNSSFIPKGQGSGVFSVTLKNLTQNTTYYYRAYATNWKGTTYGSVFSFTTPSRPPCSEANVILDDFLGNYANTNETFGTSPYGPYTTTITNVTPLTATTARITVINIFDNGWGPIEFTLDWTDPNNRTAVVVANNAIQGSNAGDLNSTYAGQTISVREPPSSLSSGPGTFSYCNQTFVLKMQLGVTNAGYFNTLYTVNMAR